MSRLRFTAECEEATERLGAALADVLPAGTVAALCGTLGSGKTRLTQAVAAACGVARDDVVSPTFVLCRQYHGRRTVNHLDVYRLRDEDEFLQLGPEEYFDSDGLTFVEWGDRVTNCLPPDRLEIHIEISGDRARQFCIAAVGSRLQPVIRRLQARLGAAATLKE
jgi:tRNA threonylcarbamoyladenosine biosynthesis protein TsaE